jgi:hypothetical protein
VPETRTLKQEEKGIYFEQKERSEVAGRQV